MNDKQPYVFAVFGLGEVDQVVVVHVLGVQQVAVLLLAQVLGVDAVGPQELLVSHAEGLSDGLSNQLGLWLMLIGGRDGGQGTTLLKHLNNVWIECQDIL